MENKRGKRKQVTPLIRRRAATPGAVRLRTAPHSSRLRLATFPPGGRLNLRRKPELTSIGLLPFAIRRGKRPKGSVRDLPDFIFPRGGIVVARGNPLRRASFVVPLVVPLRRLLLPAVPLLLPQDVVSPLPSFSFVLREKRSRRGICRTARSSCSPRRKRICPVFYL